MNRQVTRLMLLFAADVVLLALLFAGCATGHPVGPVRSLQGAAATLVCVRTIGPLGIGMTATVTIDGADVYELGAGEHVTLPLDSGERFIGVRTGGTHPTQVIQVEMGRTYYLWVGLDRIDRLNEAEGRELFTETTGPAR